MIDVSVCPVCNNSEFSPLHTCTDYTVSRETFRLIKCEVCGMVITSPRPANNELGKYYLSDDYISHSRKNASLLDLIYRLARKFTLSWKIRVLRREADLGNRPSPSLLDYGCGTGDFLSEAKKKGFTVAGVEPSEKARSLAEQTANTKVHPDIASVKNDFDVITLWHVLEHIPDLQKILNELSLRLKKNGTIFIAVPNPSSDDAEKYKELWAGYDVPRHLWHFNQKAMDGLITKHGMHIRRILPMKLDAYYVSLLSEKYKNGTTSIHGMLTATLNGFRSNQRAKETNEYSSLIYVIKK